LPSQLRYSNHSLIRMAQRSISDADVEYVLQHGEKYHRAGAVHYFLGKRQILGADQKRDSVTRLEGTTVLLATDPGAADSVITVYRNRLAPRKIRRKTKYDLRPR
jgi:hypothetical protein